ncbi:MAG: histidine kinase dimerization/phospho-acceptor domain-containing protein [Anaeromyxobacter sp.]
MPNEVDHRRRVELLRRAWVLTGASALILMAHLVDVLVAGGPDWGALALRSAWAAAVLATAASLAWGPWALTRWLGAAASFATTACYLALVVRSGGAASPLYPFTLVLVIVVPVLTGELVLAGLASAAALVAGAAWLQAVATTAQPHRIAEGVTLAAAFTLGSLLGISDLRARQRLRALAVAREEAVRRLAESERLAAVGALAAEVAHGVNNPLAAARSSAEFLRSGEGGPEDAAAAWADLRGSLDRISEQVRRLVRAGAPPEG